jgi:two-component system NtrC family response regulator
MGEGRFREDLYYRLNVFRVHIPPLRERLGDVPALAASFLSSFGAELGRGPLSLTAGAAEALCRYPWPGNVRELRNVIERAAVLAAGPQVDEALVATLLPAAVDPGARGFLLDAAVSEAEQSAILRALSATGGSRPEAAALLGIGERTLFTKLKKHGL